MCLDWLVRRFRFCRIGHWRISHPIIIRLCRVRGILSSVSTVPLIERGKGVSTPSSSFCGCSRSRIKISCSLFDRQISLTKSSRFKPELDSEARYLQKELGFAKYFLDTTCEITLNRIRIDRKQTLHDRGYNQTVWNPPW